MNKLIVHTAPQRFFAATFTSVESVTTEGNPVTIGVIYRNKHGRTNLSGMNGRFVAGSGSKRDVMNYAKRTFTADTNTRSFIRGGYVYPV